MNAASTLLRFVRDHGHESLPAESGAELRRLDWDVGNACKRANVEAPRLAPYYGGLFVRGTAFTRLEYKVDPDRDDRITLMPNPQWFETMAMLAEMLTESKKPVGRNEDRDKFIYDSRANDRALCEIGYEIRHHEGWRPLADKSVWDAGKRYATRHKLPWPPSRSADSVRNDAESK